MSDFAFDLYQDRVADAITECIQHQDDTGCEMGILLDSSGNVIGRTYGDNGHIEWEYEQLNAAPGGLIVHNHPSGASLSAEDIVCAGAFEVSILACTKDGSRFWARPEGFRKDATYITDDAKRFFAIAKGPALEISSSRARRALWLGMPEESVDIAASHEEVLEMCAQLPLKLNYHFRLSADAKFAVAHWNRVMHCNIISDDSETYVSQCEES